jgi:hypothetical protein
VTTSRPIDRGGRRPRVPLCRLRGTLDNTAPLASMSSPSRGLGRVNGRCRRRRVRRDRSCPTAVALSSSQGIDIVARLRCRGSAAPGRASAFRIVGLARQFPDGDEIAGRPSRWRCREGRREGRAARASPRSTSAFVFGLALGKLEVNDRRHRDRRGGGCPSTRRCRSPLAACAPTASTWTLSTLDGMVSVCSAAV